jgi:hypothetical protein
MDRDRDRVKAATMAMVTAAATTTTETTTTTTTTTITAMNMTTTDTLVEGLVEEAAKMVEVLLTEGTMVVALNTEGEAHHLLLMGGNMTTTTNIKIKINLNTNTNTITEDSSLRKNTVYTYNLLHMFQCHHWDQDIRQTLDSRHRHVL